MPPCATPLEPPDMPPPAPIVFHVTPHGYGHTVRLCDIVNALTELRPDVPVMLRSSLPEHLFRDRIPGAFEFHTTRPYDVGLIQLDSVRGDPVATLPALEALRLRREEDLKTEQEFIIRRQARLVVGDIPGLPLRAASELGVPAVATGNFSWNWIYEYFARTDPRWRPYAAMYRGDYAHARLLLRQPFHEPMDAFGIIEDLPILARPGRNRREELARALGLDPAWTWVLLSFGHLEWPPEALDRIERMERHAFLCLPPLGWPRHNFRTVDRARFSFRDVMASCDAVLTKPGFGVVSDALVQDKPIVYARRHDWPESEMLEEAMRTHGRSAPLETADLYRGRIGTALAAALAAPPPRERLPAGGDLVAARRLIEVYDGR